MLIVSADTSGKNGSIALAQAGLDGSCAVIETLALEGGNFSAQLVPQLATLLAKHGFTKHEIAGLAIVSGPGSFTGLRVGLAAIKALAEVLEKPIAAVSLLEIVASAGHTQGKVMAALDAGRGEIYGGEYEISTSATRLNERLLTRDEFLAAAHDFPVITPDAVIAESARRQGLQVEEIAYPRADAVARQGWKKILSGEIVSPAALEANYIRRSDAEIFAKPSNSIR